jgi:V8-like Glu-specific endopeptidase
MKNSAKRLTTILFVLTSLFLGENTASAVENGDLADGSAYVVPITAQTSATTSQSCSGAVLTPLVIATAGHCVLDLTGLLSAQILVGNPGSSNAPSNTWAKVIKIYVSDEYKGNSAAGIVGASDVAFLLLDRSVGNEVPVSLASENELLSMKNSGAKLRIIGYGANSDSGDRSTSPYGFDSTFSKTTPPDPNQALAVSQKADVCKGDSGAPVMNITPTKVTLVGVLTGAYLSINCSKKQNDGSYLAAFTAINRFSNLATQAISDSLKAEQARSTTNQQNAATETENLNARISEQETQITDLTDRLEKLQQSLDKSMQILAAYKASGQQAITCSNLVSIKIIVGKAPKCPKGFKKE